MKEEWRFIKNYEGLYEVSNTGLVRSIDRYTINSKGVKKRYKGKLLSPGFNKRNGYFLVRISKDCFYVHRLVAEAFLDNPDNLREVNHKDEDKTNNRVDNLEWCTSKYNRSYGTRTERQRNTNIKNGFWTGLSKEEYRNKYREEHRDLIRSINRKAYYKRKHRRDDISTAQDIASED